jgi:hypothetical protein
MYSGLKNEEIGKLFGGIHYNAVTKASTQLTERMGKNRQLRKRAQEVFLYQDLTQRCATVSKT